MNKSVEVSIPARLNVSALCMDDLVLGRLGGGGLGFAIKLFTKVTIEITGNKEDHFFGGHHKIANYYVNFLKNKYKITKSLTVRIEQQLKQHAGLSSSSSVAIGIIFCFNELFSLNLSNDEIISLYSSDVMEEHDGIVREGFLTGVSSWAMCLGGMVIVDTDGSLIGHYQIDEKTVDNILIVSPKELLGNSIEEEVNLLKGKGTKLDLIDKTKKRSLFMLIKECFDAGDQRMGLTLMNQLLFLGSKIAEIEYQDSRYNNLISKLLFTGREKEILTIGMSAMGPTMFFIDNKQKIDELIVELNNSNLQIEYKLTSFQNLGIINEYSK